MTKSQLAGTYRDYIACLNRQDWPSLEFVDGRIARVGSVIDEAAIEARWRDVGDAQQ
jgi:predicted ester cyclase